MIRIKHYISNTFNIGDSLISDSVSKLAIERLPNCDIFKVCQQGNELWQNFHGINHESFQIGFKPDLILIGGHPIIGSEELCKIDNPEIFFEVPTYMVGIGARFDRKKFSLNYVKKMGPILSSIKAISCRDRVSFDFCKEFNSHVYLTGCPALFRYEYPLSTDTRSDYVTISFDGRGLSDHFYFQLLNDIKKMGLKPLLLIHDFRELARAKKIANASGCYFIATPDYRYLHQYIKHARFTVAFRMHGGILSLSVGTPSVFINNDIRGYELCKLVGIDEDFSVQIGPPPSENTNLPNRILRRLKRPSNEKQLLDYLKGSNRRLADEKFPCNTVSSKIKELRVQTSIFWGQVVTANDGRLKEHSL